MRQDERRISMEIENMRLYITLYNGFFDLGGCRAVVHNHNRYEIHLTLEGAIDLRTEEGGFTLKKGEGCIIAPNLVHSCEKSEKQSIKSSFCFSFEKIGSGAETGIYEVFSEAFQGIEGMKKIRHGKKYITELKKIMSEFYSEKPFCRLKIRSHFFLLMLSIAEDLLSGRSDLLPPERGEVTDMAEKDIRRVMIEEYVNQNYNQDISLCGLSKILFLSEKQTGRVFEQEFGMNFKAYVQEFRLKAAMYYLCNTSLPVNEISLKVGYQSYNGFYKLFLSHVGQTPKKYRSAHSAP